MIEPEFDETTGLPLNGRWSPSYKDDGVWNYCLGPASPIPGEHLLILMLERNETTQKWEAARSIVQIRGEITDPGYVSFFESLNDRPCRVSHPVLDVDEDGQPQDCLLADAGKYINNACWRPILERWVEKHSLKRQFAE